MSNPKTIKNTPIAFSTKPQVPPKPRHPAHEWGNEESRNDEGQCHSQPIGQEQQGPIPSRFRTSCGKQNRRQNRTDTRGPAKGKGQTDHIGTDQAEVRHFPGIKTHLPIEQSDLDHP